MGWVNPASPWVQGALVGNELGGLVGAARRVTEKLRSNGIVD